MAWQFPVVKDGLVTANQHHVTSKPWITIFIHLKWKYKYFISRFLNNEETFDEAQLYCQNLGSHLAIIGTKKEREYISLQIGQVICCKI